MKKILFSSLALLLGACASGPSAGASDAAARVLRADASPTVEFGEGVALKLTGEGNSAVSQLRVVERPGYRTPLHVHHEMDEMFYVVSGELTLFFGGVVHKLRAGDYAFVPRGTPHAQGNETTQENVVILTMVPGTFEGFFDDRAELVKETPPQHPDYGAGMMRVGKPYDIEILGPAPY